MSLLQLPSVCGFDVADRLQYATTDLTDRWLYLTPAALAALLEALL